MFRKKRLSIVVFILALFAFSGCSTYDNVYSMADENVDFSAYKTYAWLNTHKSDTATYYSNDIIENNVKSYVDREFADRGYVVNLEEPDLLLRLVLVNEKKQETVSNPYNCDNNTYYNYSYNPSYNINPYFTNPYYNNYNYYYYQQYHRPLNLSGCDYSICNNQTVEYIKGTITINVIDRKLNKLVWTGSAEGDIYDPQYLKNEIHPAVKRILEKYPVKSKVKQVKNS